MTLPAAVAAACVVNVVAAAVVAGLVAVQASAAVFRADAVTAVAAAPLSVLAYRAGPALALREQIWDVLSPLLTLLLLLLDDE